MTGTPFCILAYSSWTLRHSTSVDLLLFGKQNFPRTLSSTNFIVDLNFMICECYICMRIFSFHLKTFRPVLTKLDRPRFHTVGHFPVLASNDNSFWSIKLNKFCMLLQRYTSLSAYIKGIGSALLKKCNDILSFDSAAPNIRTVGHWRQCTVLNLRMDSWAHNAFLHKVRIWQIYYTLILQNWNCYNKTIEHLIHFGCTTTVKVELFFWVHQKNSFLMTKIQSQYSFTWCWLLTLVSTF